jgi:hypothetical protein
VSYRKYGLEFPDGTNDLTVELFCFLHGREPDKGGLGKYEHFKNAVDLLFNNKEKPTARGFSWNEWNEDFVWLACQHQYLSVAGCASSGKSDTAAMWGIINYLADPTGTLVLATSTTLREARRRIWKSMTELWSAVPGLPGKIVPSLGQIKGMSANGGFTESTGVVLVPAERKREREAIGKLVGIKARRLILLADELPELPESILHAAYTNLATNPSFQMIALGNPASHFDAFGMFSEPKEGWGSVTENDMEWETKRGWCIRFDARRNPNLYNPGSAPWMPDRSTIEAARRDYGDDSLMFCRMFKGWWAAEGTNDGIYTEADILKGCGSAEVKFDKPPVMVAALDPSFTNGGDRSMATFGKLGEVGGTKVLQITEHVVIAEEMTDKETPRTAQIAKKFADECKKRGVKPENASLDVTGAGTPFKDVLSMEWSPKVLGINFAGQASEKPVSAHDRTLCKDKFANRMTELWWGGVELLRSGQLKGISPELAKEMTARKYVIKTGGKTKVEPKEDYRVRVGRSPDLADSAFILIELCKVRHGLLGGERLQASASRMTDWNRKMKSMQLSTPTLLDQ